MSYARRVRSVTSRARAEAYAGLLLLVLGLTVLAFGKCPPSERSKASRPAEMPLRVSGGKVPPSVGYGNALDDGGPRKGWWVGHFMQTDSPRYSSQIETKWVSHRAGKKHDGFSTNKLATSMAVLISGKHRIEFEEYSVYLENPGDYVIWGSGVAHSWSALEDSTMLCIRWPSIDGDQIHTSANASSLTSSLNLRNHRTTVGDQGLSASKSRNASAEPNRALATS